MPANHTADRTASADEQAEDRTRETRSFMRSVRRATRRKYAPEEKIRKGSAGKRPSTTCAAGRGLPRQLLFLDQGVHGSWQVEVAIAGGKSIGQAVRGRTATTRASTGS